MSSLSSPGSAQSTAQPIPVTEPVVPARRWWRPPTGNPFARAAYLLTLGIVTIIFLYPFVWAVSSSLKTRNDFFDNQARLIPRPFNWVNYKQVFTGVPGQVYQAAFGTWLWNSLWIAVLAALTVTISSALVAFAFAYFRFPLRNFFFGCVLATMMLPGVATLVPTYLLWNKLGFTGPGTFLFLSKNQYPLWAPNLFGSAFYIFLMRQFFLGIPRELFEAARMDGDNYWTMFWRIAAPLARPAMIVTAVFEFKANWTELQKSLIYLRSDATFTIPRGLKNLLDLYGPSNGGHGDYQVIVAATVLATLPMIVVFFLGQRYFVEGIATQGRKG
ncbi:MAG TPA: carbohydrate ABC transporter permease [Gaiellaceae bacterium]|nr:carbohydrate ABC transporter permease [Gaiellaceae bacterium]